MTDNKTDNQIKILIGEKERLGSFCDVFAIRTGKNMGIIDFGFKTPEGEVVIFCRTIMEKGTLKALAKAINEQVKDVEDKKA